MFAAEDALAVSSAAIGELQACASSEGSMLADADVDVVELLLVSKRTPLLRPAILIL
jgi:hypothetical protein